MSVKNQVIVALEENKGQSFSGALLAETLGVSRAAVWKAISSLRAEGYPIEAIPNKGYSLLESGDILSAEGIRIHLDKAYADLPIYVHKSIDSTNKEAKKMALEDTNYGSVIIANHQTAGRGRLGRSFYSPADDGIYMSFLLKPFADMSKSLLITSATAVATARAMEEVFPVKAEIKWVNDIYINNKKICGILTEAVTNFETRAIDFIIPGIGINYRPPQEGFPEDLITKAGSLIENIDHTSASRNILAAKVINNLLQIYDDIENPSIIEEYRKRSMVIGREVTVIKRPGFEDEKSALVKAIDIDSNCGLIVEHEDGTVETLNTGEISIRL